MGTEVLVENAAAVALEGAHDALGTRGDVVIAEDEIVRTDVSNELSLLVRTGDVTEGADAVVQRGVAGVSRKQLRIDAAESVGNGDGERRLTVLAGLHVLRALVLRSRHAIAVDTGLLLLLGAGLLDVLERARGLQDERAVEALASRRNRLDRDDVLVRTLRVVIGTGVRHHVAMLIDTTNAFKGTLGVGHLRWTLLREHRTIVVTALSGARSDDIRELSVFAHHVVLCTLVLHDVAELVGTLISAEGTLRRALFRGDELSVETARACYVSTTTRVPTWNGNRIRENAVVAFDIPIGTDSIDKDPFVAETTHSREGTLERRGREVTEVGFDETISLATHARVHLQHFAPLSVFTDVIVTRGIQRLGNAFLSGTSQGSVSTA